MRTHVLLYSEEHAPVLPGSPANTLQCLCTWFVSNKARKTCPDCRILVKELPAPAYVVSALTPQPAIAPAK